MSTAAVAQRPAVGRRGALFIVVLGLVLAVLAALSANSYLAGEAERVAAPQRDAWVAARDVPAGTLLARSDLTIARFPVANEMASHYALVSDPARPPEGITPVALRKGQPILAGTFLPPEAADTVSPLVPLTIGGGRTVGAVILPLGRLSLPPAPFRPGDKLDLWAQAIGPSGAPGSLTIVLEGFEAITETDEGVVIAVTRDQLERLLTFSNQGSPMLLTVRSSRRE